MTQYGGTAYIGVVGPETEFGVCRDSIQAIARRVGDSPPRFLRATKGYEARNLHLHDFYYNTKHDWCFLVDHDMVFAVDTLEKLRRHGVSFISGYYMRRRWDPVYSVWFYYEDDNTLWPKKPYHSNPVPEKNGLVKLGASGWGCMLVHRQVLTDMLPLLKGEDWIIEDDMDIWPYDLKQVMKAVNGLRDLMRLNPDARTFKAAAKTYSEILSEEIRLNRGKKDVVGSDIRFPFFAREVGHVLYGDPEVRPTHIIYYELSPFDFESVADGQRAEFAKQVEEKVAAGRKGIKKNLRKLRRAGK